jgi:cell division septum initiation protein DivIVA
MPPTRSDRVKRGFSMTTEYGKTVVDVHSLEDFQTALNNHHSAAVSMLKTIENKLWHVSPKLGTFSDGNEMSNYYSTTANDYHDRVQRLKSAIEAAQQATKTILATYKTAEARNDANSKDIERTLAPVGTALKEKA